MARRSRHRKPPPAPVCPEDPRLAATAVKAWTMLVREEAPMLPHAAIDWMRQEAECEDVSAVKRALLWVAAEWLENQRLDNLRGSIIHQRIKTAEFDEADKQAKSFPTNTEWHGWYSTAQRVVALCRELNAL